MQTPPNGQTPPTIPHRGRALEQERIRGLLERRAPVYYPDIKLLMAMLDGVINRIDPGEPLDRNIYDLEPEVLKNLPRLPATLDEALSALEKDHDFLIRGDVFTEDVLSTWIRDKREKEVDSIRARPHPFEFNLYYDV